MKGIVFNDGLSEVIDNSELQTFTKNLPKVDRLTQYYQNARLKANSTPVPVTSMPQPAVTLEERVRALKAETKAKLKAVAFEYKTVLVAAKQAYDTRVKAGMDPARADTEMKATIETAKINAAAKSKDIKLSALEIAKSIQRSCMEQAMDYVREIKNRYTLEIQAREKKIADAQDLFKSNKISKESADAVCIPAQREIEALSNKMKTVVQQSQIKALDLCVKMGIMSSVVAEQLKQQKKEEITSIVAASQKTPEIPNVSYNVIDKETGREISKGDLERHLQYLKSKNAPVATINKLNLILANLRRANISNIITVQMHMIPEARSINTPTGEHVYSVSESARIVNNQSSVEIPANSIAGEEPNDRFNATAIPELSKKAITDLSAMIKGMSEQFNAKFMKLNSLGKGNDVRALMMVDNIRALHGEIRNGAQTGKETTEIYGLMQRLKDTYADALKDINKLLEV